ncbi:MAG: nitroreductase family protein [Coprothermobacterota bacterium]|nr:nitroreductase family protein [Coprothermobacterota bacterium]
METWDAIRTRRSIRKYKPLPVEEDKLARILEVLQYAPSAKNLQPWRVILVQDPATIEKLAVACRNQKYLTQAPILLAICGLEGEAYQTMGGYWNSLAVDCSILLDQLTLAACSEGLGTCWIGAYHEEEVKAVLGIPPEIRVIALTPLGYPDEEPNRRPRKALSEVLFLERWGQSGE